MHIPVHGFMDIILCSLIVSLDIPILSTIRRKQARWSKWKKQESKGHPSLRKVWILTPLSPPFPGFLGHSKK